MRFIDDPRSLLAGEKNLEFQRLALEEAVVVDKAAAAESRADYRKQQTLQVAILRNNRAGNQLLVDYSAKYLLE